MTAFTARVLEPGECYPDRRNGPPQIRRVPPSHYGVVCQACPYAVHIPTRLGRDVAEQRRRDHLTTVHLSKLCTGTVVLTETPPAFASSESRVHRAAAGDTGSLDGTAGPHLRSARLAPPPAVPPTPSGRHFVRTG